MMLRNRLKTVFSKRINQQNIADFELLYKPTANNQKLVRHIARLHNTYKPTPWLPNTHFQLLFLEIKKTLNKPLAYDHIEPLTMSDGGQTALAWYGYNLPATTPTIVILHTLTGSPKSMQDMVKDLHDYTGWRIVVAVRRGHANLAFDPPRFNMFGSTQDLDEQLQRIEQLFPDSPRYAVGSSAGSGLLIRYLGEAKTSARFNASFAFSPGYNIDEGFAYCHPLYSKYMTRKLIKRFVIPNQTQLQHLSTFKPLSKSTDLLTLHQQMYEFSGYSSYQDYSAATNPMQVFDQITIPVMVLNAHDDPVCNIQNANPYLPTIQQMPNMILVRTKRGSHCAYQHGWQAKSWAHQLIAEYFQAIEQNPDNHPRS